MKKFIQSTFLASTLVSAPTAYSLWIDEDVRNDTPLPLQTVQATGPAMTAVRVKIQWDIYLLLLTPSDTSLFPEKLLSNINNTQEKVRTALHQMILKGKLPAWTEAVIESYGTTTAVDIGNKKVWLLTAAHVMNIKSENDVCITNQIMWGNMPTHGVSILNTTSSQLNWKMGHTQFPIYEKSKFMMIQISSILRYAPMRKGILARFPIFQWWSSGAPVIVEDPKQPWTYGIVSIFPGWVEDNKRYIANMPRVEILNSLKKKASDAAQKWWNYAVCE